MTANEIENLLNDLKLDRVSSSSAEVVACCPIHGERRPSFGVSVEKSGHPYNCFACHASGYLPKLVMELQGVGWKEAFTYVNRFGHYSVEDTMFAESDSVIYETRWDSTEELFDRSLLAVFDSPNLRMKSYLKRRKVAASVVREAGLLRLPISKETGAGGRAVFVWYSGHTPVGLTSRSYVSENDRMRGLPLFNFKKHQHVYPAWGASPLRKVKSVVVTEGELDALRVQRITPAAALSGTSITEAQVQQLSSMTEQVVLLPDNDAAGFALAQNFAQAVRSRFPVFIPTILPDKYTDPSAASDKLIKTVLSEDNLELLF